MNTPNKLTILRIVMAPLFLVFMLWDTLPFHYLIAMALFIAASVTDLLDGKIARKRNLITNFGKLLDPLADKMLVTAALLGMLSEGICGVWIPMIILTRELVKILIDETDLPVVVDAGIGKPSEAAEAMELGASAVLVNTAIATANDPIRMAKAFSLAVKAGREAFLAGPGSVSEFAEASSPLTGFLR